jgi:nitrile hydratase
VSAATRIRAIEALLVERGVLAREDLRFVIDNLTTPKPADGAAVVARAWSDPAFERRLLDDANAAIRELGFGGAIAFTNLFAVQNTERLHHVVVGTLDASGYPRQLLGPPPRWYKSLAYRARAVREPRAVLREFGTELGDEVEVRVLDAVSHDRYLVIPRRPDSSEGLQPSALAALVTRESMVGLEEARPVAA